MLNEKQCLHHEAYWPPNPIGYTMPPLSETETETQRLLKQLSEGNQTAFEKLWAQSENTLYHHCLQWMGGHHADAKDALSLVALKAWEKLPHYAQNITHPQAWLIQMAHNLCVDLLKKSHQETVYTESLENLLLKEEGKLASELYSPEWIIQNREIEHYMRQAIETLPIKLRDPFKLFYWQELSYQEIAQQLSLSHDTVRKSIQQARTHLRQKINPCLFGGNDEHFPESTQSEPSQTVDKDRTKAVWDTVEWVHYKVTATCLESLSHAWYPSLSPLA